MGVLKGAVFFLGDLMRFIDIPVEVDFMAVASSGSATDSSGVVRILKDLDTAIDDRDVLIIEDIVDSGLTLQYLLRNLGSRNLGRTLECVRAAEAQALEARPTQGGAAGEDTRLAEVGDTARPKRGEASGRAGRLTASGEHPCFASSPLRGLLRSRTSFLSIGYGLDYAERHHRNLRPS